MKKIIMFLLLAILAISAVSASMTAMAAKSGGKLDLYVRISNPTSDDWDNNRIIVYSPVLGILERSTGFDVDDHSRVTKRISINIPEDASGFYLLRIYLRGEDIKDTTHTWIAV